LPSKKLVGLNKYVEVLMGNPILHSIKSTAEILDIGRSSVYGLISAKKIKAVKIGRRTLITDQSIQHLVDELVAQNPICEEG
jgi:excisionase family DNA binding protein